MQDALPPYRTNSGPGDGVEPRTPQTNNRTEGESTGCEPAGRSVTLRVSAKGIAVRHLSELPDAAAADLGLCPIGIEAPRSSWWWSGAPAQPRGTAGRLTGRQIRFELDAAVHLAVGGRLLLQEGRWERVRAGAVGPIPPVRGPIEVHVAVAEEIHAAGDLIGVRRTAVLVAGWVAGRITDFRIGRVVGRYLVGSAAGLPEGIGEAAHGEGDRIRDRRAGREVADLVLGENATLQGRPRHQVLRLGSAVLRLVIEGHALAVSEDGRHVAVGR